jgi:hypothetical protein
MELDEVIELFTHRVINKERFYSQYGTAKDVDKDTRTCTFVPAGDDAERFNIRLQATMSGKLGFIIVPKEGSDIAVTFVNKSTGFVSLTTEAEKILIDTETFQMNGGEKGGLINVEDLISKLNAIEKDLNNLKKAFASWVPVLSGDGGAALKVLLAQYSGKLFLETKRSEIEDTKVTH